MPASRRAELRRRPRRPRGRVLAARRILLAAVAAGRGRSGAAIRVPAARVAGRARNPESPCRYRGRACFVPGGRRRGTVVARFDARTHAGGKRRRRRRSVRREPVRRASAAKAGADAADGPTGFVALLALLQGGALAAAQGAPTQVRRSARRRDRRRCRGDDAGDVAAEAARQGAAIAGVVVTLSAAAGAAARRPRSRTPGAARRDPRRQRRRAATAQRVRLPGSRRRCGAGPVGGEQ